MGDYNILRLLPSNSSSKAVDFLCGASPVSRYHSDDRCAIWVGVNMRATEEEEV